MDVNFSKENNKMKIKLTLILIFTFLITNLLPFDLFSQITYVNTDFYMGKPKTLKFKDGNLYCKGYNGGSKDYKNDYMFTMFDGNEFEKLSTEINGFPNEVIDEFALGYGVNGDNLAITESNGIYSIYHNSIYHFYNNKWQKIFQKDTLSNDSIKYTIISICNNKDDVYFLQKKQMLLYKTNQGTNVWDNVGGTLFKINGKEVSIVKDTIYVSTNSSDYLFANSTISIDKKGNLILFNSRKLGIFNLITNELKSFYYETKSGTTDQPKSFSISENNEIVVGFKKSKGSISIFKDNVWKIVDLDKVKDITIYYDYVSNPNVIYYAKDSSIWIGSVNGVVKISKNTIEKIIPEDYHLTQYENSVYAITESTNGDIYIGVHNGILIYKNKELGVENYNNFIGISKNLMFSENEGVNIPLIFNQDFSNIYDVQVVDLNGKKINFDYNISNNILNIDNNLMSGTYSYYVKTKDNFQKGIFLINK